MNRRDKADEDAGWATIGMALEHGWPSETFTAGTEGGYRVLLSQYGAATVTAALERLTDRGVSPDAHALDKKRRPTAPEIAQECRVLLGRAGVEADFDAPAWVEVYPVAERAAYRWMNRSKAAVDHVREQLGDVAAAWFANGGREQILGTMMGDGEFGHRNRVEVGRTYDAFVQTQRSRVARGLPVTTVEARGGLVAAVDQVRALPGGQA